jgi:hypothetical protein
MSDAGGKHLGTLGPRYTKHKMAEQEMDETSNYGDLDEGKNWDGIGFSVRSDILWPTKMFESIDPDAYIEFKDFVDDQRDSQIIPKKGSECILSMINHAQKQIIVFFGPAKYIGQTSTHYMLQISSGVHKYSKKDQIVFNSKNSFEQFIMLLTLKYKDSDVDVIVKNNSVMEAKYQGRTVTLNSPMAGDIKKSKVYVKNAKGNVVKVNFGEKGARIKKSNPGRRKSFRARHGCDNPGPRWKAKYWSCRAW